MRFYSGPDPAIGSNRSKKGFAFLPKRIDRNTTIWLERYYRNEIYFQPMPRGYNRYSPSWCPYDSIRNEVLDPVRGWTTYHNSANNRFTDLPVVQDPIIPPPNYVSAVVPDKLPMKVPIQDEPKQHLSREQFMTKEMK